MRSNSRRRPAATAPANGARRDPVGSRGPGRGARDQRLSGRARANAAAVDRVVHGAVPEPGLDSTDRRRKSFPRFDPRRWAMSRPAALLLWSVSLTASFAGCESTQASQDVAPMMLFEGLLTFEAHGRTYGIRAPEGLAQRGGVVEMWSSSGGRLYLATTAPARVVVDPPVISFGETTVVVLPEKHSYSVNGQAVMLTGEIYFEFIDGRFDGGGFL